MLRVLDSGSVMDRLLHSASGRLGFWDSMPRSDDFRSRLEQLLESHSHAVIQTDTPNFAETPTPATTAIAAVCDKIVARGNPTLIDPDFEEMLLSKQGVEFFQATALVDQDDIGVRFQGSRLPQGSSTELLNAAQDLLDLPYRDEASLPGQTLSADLQKLCSIEEEWFYDSLVSHLGRWAAGFVQRQPLISDLVAGELPPELSGSRVDFVLQMSRAHWVMEIDGAQHLEPSERQRDELRDRTLKSAGWKVLRIPASTVRSGPGAWLKESFGRASPEESRSLGAAAKWHSVKSATERSMVHRAAWHTVVVPLALQRCLRGLLKMYSCGALDAERHQRVLLVEEDAPVAADAFRLLLQLWSLVHRLSPQLGAPPPSVSLDVIGEEGLFGTDPPVRRIDGPEGGYDAVISHCLLLGEGRTGPLSARIAPQLADTALRIRRAVGLRGERRLEHSESFRYDIDGDSQEQADAMRRILQAVFRKREFRDGQAQAIRRLLNGEPAIVLLPTGGGKSLIYQFAGMLLPGMTVIIDPIISLMDDQVGNLRGMGIDRVGDVSSQLTAGTKTQLLDRLAAGKLAYIFIAPERLQSEDFRVQLRSACSKMPISLAVVDEAHCLSEWGHDFRPSYLHLPMNLQRYCSDQRTALGPTLVALTGTASFAVLEDIQAELEINDEDAVIRPTSFDRRELSFDVRQTSWHERPSALQETRSAMPRRLGVGEEGFFQPDRGEETDCGLVFCPHVDDQLGVVNVAAQLGHSNYYAGRKPKKFSGDWNQHKQALQRLFTQNRVQELVATKSFGMGIDKPNIRYTMHYGMPGSVEAFYQEAGRAGRNGREGYALCTVLYSDDSWEQALAILDEPDHHVAMRRLKAVRRNRQGDVLTHLWFLLNSYKGREEEKKSTLDLWGRQLAGERTAKVSFRNGDDRGVKEKCIYRLSMLGLVEDYTVDWRNNKFVLMLRDAGSHDVTAQLRRYLGKYKFPDYVDRLLEPLSAAGGDVVERAVGVLVDFIYDEVVAKRKEAIRTMAELCRGFKSSEDFRDGILAYLQDSEFSGQLNEWRGRSFEQVGLTELREVLERPDTPDRLRQLIGTTRRVLEADPGNAALRYLSVCARARSDWESDASVLNETSALIARLPGGESNPELVQMELLHDLETWRPSLVRRIAAAMMSAGGGLALARRLLSTEEHVAEVVRLAALKTIVDNIAGVVARSSEFYDLEAAGRA